MYFFLHNFTLTITYFAPVHFLEMLYKFGKGLIVFLLYRFRRFLSLDFVFLLYRFRFISFHFVFLLYRFRFISLDFADRGRSIIRVMYVRGYLQGSENGVPVNWETKRNETKRNETKIQRNQVVQTESKVATESENTVYMCSDCGICFAFQATFMNHICKGKRIMHTLILSHFPSSYDWTVMGFGHAPTF
jgi:hypothetical protein